MTLGATLALMLLATGCSLQQKKELPSPPAPTKTIIIRQNQALDWSVEQTYYLSNDVTLSYPLCPRQHLIGKPVVALTADNVAVTLWANPMACANPGTRTIVVHLDQPLGHRPLVNPDLGR